ncbi:MAG: penicillin-insensitive murein endopeptidase [Proteobacteria bacterium]|nr:penicillin-insensitive murein endopeptidase [Pseudomonadota bacterium]
MIKKILMFCFVIAGAAVAADDFNPWEKISTPTAGKHEIFGGYNAGCLQGARAPQETGVGYQLIELSRNKFWAHQTAIDYISDLGRNLRPQGMSLLVADVSMPRGGPFTWDHASHQVGLDLDIEFLQDPRSLQRPLTVEEREKLPKFYLADSEANDIISANWDEKYVTMLRAAAEDSRTHVIFVHPAIKRKICQSPANRKPWLAKIEPWWGHDEHFHVRLKCPADGSSPNCKSKPEITEIGCDSPELAWWFSDEWRQIYEARKKWQKDNPNPAPEPLPALPSHCQSVLTNNGSR